MVRRFRTLKRLLAALQESGLAEVGVAGRVSTQLKRDGRIAFRGQLRVQADLKPGDVVEYIEQVTPYVTAAGSGEICSQEKEDGEVAHTQQVVRKQLQMFCDHYQGIMEAARLNLYQALSEAGLQIREAGE